MVGTLGHELRHIPLRAKALAKLLKCEEDRFLIVTNGALPLRGDRTTLDSEVGPARHAVTVVRLDHDPRVPGLWPRLLNEGLRVMSAGAWTPGGGRSPGRPVRSGSVRGAGKIRKRDQDHDPPMNSPAAFTRAHPLSDTSNDRGEWQKFAEAISISLFDGIAASCRLPAE